MVRASRRYVGKATGYMKGKGTVYVLVNAKGRYYVGSTNDLQRRIKEHNLGNTKFTREQGPWRLAFHQYYNTLSQARKVERTVKRLKRKDIIERIIREGRIKLGG